MITLGRGIILRFLMCSHNRDYTNSYTCDVRLHLNASEYEKYNFVPVSYITIRAENREGDDMKMIGIIFHGSFSNVL